MKVDVAARSDAHHNAGRAAPVLVVVYPWDINPYQELLYSAMDPASVKVARVRHYPRALTLPFLIATAWYRLRGARIIHIHWPTFAAQVGRRRPLKLSLWLSRWALLWVRALGYRVVWTIHNLLPHQAETSDDLAVARALARRSRVMIVHSPTVCRDAISTLGAPPERLFVVPLGNYRSAYKPCDARPIEARREWGTDRADFVFLFFGNIRPYKGLPRLVSTFQARFHAGEYLVVAGDFIDDAEALDMLSNCDPLRRVICRPGRVPDDEVAGCFASADVACFPFESCTTSSSAVLALSFATPIVAPRLGALCDLPDGVGWFYDPLDSRGLEEAMVAARAASADELLTKSRAALEFAQSLSWKAIADETLELYLGRA
jgi:beta-1,4-mannosyltransferase